MYATAPHGLQYMLQQELQSLGATDAQVAGAGVRFHASPANAYRITLNTRLANRILLPIHRGPAADPEQLYAQTQLVDWSQHLTLKTTFAIDFFSAESTITHTGFGALKIKDAIVDQFRDACGERPSVERKHPDLRINAYLHRDQVRLAIDWSGASLHQRGYRVTDTTAPIKENLAAAMLMASDWPKRFSAGEHLHDPMCGSGTLVIEAAMLAADIAPGLAREKFGFHGWLGHDDDLWQQERDAANQRAEIGRQTLRDSEAKISASDNHPGAITASEENIEAAGLTGLIDVRREDFFTAYKTKSISAQEDLNKNDNSTKGLIIFNPPYGERLSTGPSPVDFFRNCARALREQYNGWTATLVVSRKSPYHLLRLRNQAKDADAEHVYKGKAKSGNTTDTKYKNARKPKDKNHKTDQSRSGKKNNEKTPPTSLQFDNGGIPCRVIIGEIEGRSEHNAKSSIRTDNATTIDSKADENNSKSDTLALPQSVKQIASKKNSSDTSSGGEDFKNRLLKNRKRMSSWLKRDRITAFRLYDADIPEYAVAIDLYTGQPVNESNKKNTIESDDEQTHVVIQEYRAPATIDPARAVARLQQVVDHTRSVCDLPDSNVHVKVRERKKGASQYQRQQQTGQRLLVEEHGCRVLVNPVDYLDTGLFPDHRKVRHYIQQQAADKRFLNLFCYTATATVHAIAGGAKSSVSIDSSKRYLGWAEENIALINGGGANEAKHKLHRADVMTWLADDDVKGQFDLILLDPPTFSNSTEFDNDWDVQRNHLDCIRLCLKRLSEDGLIIFSTNFKRFRLDEQLKTLAQVEDRSNWSIGPDFANNKKIHRCWFISHARKSD